MKTLTLACNDGIMQLPAPNSSNTDKIHTQCLYGHLINLNILRLNMHQIGYLAILTHMTNDSSDWVETGIMFYIDNSDNKLWKRPKLMNVNDVKGLIVQFVSHHFIWFNRRHKPPQLLTNDRIDRRVIIRLDWWYVTMNSRFSSIWHILSCWTYLRSLANSSENAFRDAHNHCFRLLFSLHRKFLFALIANNKYTKHTTHLACDRLK